MWGLSRVVAAATLALAAVVAPAGAAAAAPDRPGGRPDVVDVAHRGSSGQAPENTLASVERALDQQATAVEVDVQRTADGELVLMHDRSLRRTTDVEEVFPRRAPWRVSDFTLDEIDRLDAGSWFSPGFSGERVPTLREVLRAVRGRAELRLDVKATDRSPGIEVDLATELWSTAGFVQAALATDGVLVQAFDHAWLRRFHAVAPAVPVVLLYHQRPSVRELDAAAGWAEAVHTSRRVTDRRLVEEVQARSMTLNVYTLNTRRAMRAFADLGVDEITTDYPARLRAVLRRR